MSCRFNRRVREAALLAVLGLAAVLPVQAVELEVGGGVAKSVDDGEAAPMLIVTLLGEQRFTWEASVGRFGERDEGSPASRNEATNFISVGSRYQRDWWFVGSAIAYVDRTSDILSSDHQFITSVGIRYKSLVFAVRHMSNANTGGRNRGETWAQLSWRFGL